MEESALDVAWNKFIESEGRAIEKEIYEELQETANIFDVEDGTHAKWTSDRVLGLLLVLDEEEAEFLLAAFHAGIDGIEDATYSWAAWATCLMGIIKQSLVVLPDDYDLSEDN
jgi:hypothetical protein|tara:strand:- start:385 stop:723 length:339 start_codon:yes stop_codon:yes gene_type:complete